MANSEENENWYIVVEQVGSTVQSVDYWIVEIATILKKVKWVLTPVAANAIYRVFGGYFSYFPFLGQYHFWALDGPDENGYIPLLANFQDGMEPAPPPDPYYFWYVLPFNEPPMQQVWDKYMEYLGTKFCVALGRPPDDPDEFVMTVSAPAESTENSISTFTPGAAIGIQPDIGLFRYGGYIASTEISPAISVYFTQTHQQSATVSVKMSDGFPEIPRFDKHGTNFINYPVANNDTIVWCSPAAILSHVQAPGPNGASGNFIFAHVLKTYRDITGLEQSVLYGCMGNEFTNLSTGMRHAPGFWQPGESFIKYGNTRLCPADSTVTTPPHDASLALTTLQRGSTDSGVPVVWEHGGAEIMEPWASFNPFRSDGDAPILGQMYDVIVVYDAVSEVDLIARFSWDDSLWKYYTESGAERFLAPTATIALRTRRIDTPYLDVEQNADRPPMVRLEVSEGIGIVYPYRPGKFDSLFGTPFYEGNTSWTQIFLGSPPPGVALSGAPPEHATGQVLHFPAPMGTTPTFYSFQTFVYGPTIFQVETHASQIGISQRFRIEVRRRPMLDYARMQGFEDKKINLNTYMGIVRLGYPVTEYTLPAVYGWPPYAFTAVSLPDGLVVDPVTGKIYGRSKLAGDNIICVIAFEDSKGDNGVRSDPPSTDIVPPEYFFTLTVAYADVTITTSSLPSGQVGVPYFQLIEAVGGYYGYIMTISAGTLPPGLVLNFVAAQSGSVDGTPTTPGTYTFTVDVAPNTGPSDTQEYTVVIAP